MLDFEVYYDIGKEYKNKLKELYGEETHDYEGKSKVYSIDSQRHQFLIVTNSGYFKWIPTKDCEIVQEE